MFRIARLTLSALSLSVAVAYAVPAWLFAQSAPSAPPAPPPTVYVRAGHLFDATSDSLRDNVVLVVEGERITRVGSASEVSIPAGATVVDLSKAWVLPGLIDCHTHLEARAGITTTRFMGRAGIRAVHGRVPNGVVNASEPHAAGWFYQLARCGLAAVLRC